MKINLTNRIAIIASIVSIIGVLGTGVDWLISDQVTMEKRFQVIESSEKSQTDAIRVLTSEVNISQQKQDLINKLLDSQEKQGREEAQLKKTLNHTEHELLAIKKTESDNSNFGSFTPETSADAPSVQNPSLITAKPPK